jgi:hypothetical protein
MTKWLFKAMAVLHIWACGLRLRAGNASLTGPDQFHPESVEAELTSAEEDWLAAADAALWPRRTWSWRLGATYTFGSGNGMGV